MLASHARLLEVIVKDTRVANIDLPNGNPIGSERFAHKLAQSTSAMRSLRLSLCAVRWIDGFVLEGQFSNWRQIRG